MRAIMHRAQSCGRSILRRNLASAAHRCARHCVFWNVTDWSSTCRAGGRVASADLTRLIDAYAVREVLDGVAARFAAERASDADIAKLRAHVAGQDKVVDPWDPESLYPIQCRFSHGGDEHGGQCLADCLRATFTHDIAGFCAVLFTVGGPGARCNPGTCSHCRSHCRPRWRGSRTAGAGAYPRNHGKAGGGTASSGE